MCGKEIIAKIMVIQYLFGSRKKGAREEKRTTKIQLSMSWIFCLQINLQLSRYSKRRL